MTVNKILAVDVCGTLYKTNTSAGMVLLHHKRCGNAWRVFLLETLSRPKGLLRFLLIGTAKTTGFDLHRRLVFLSLRHQSTKAVQASAKLYAQDHLPPLALHEIHHRLKKMRADGWHPILVSNALQPVVAEIALKLNLPFIASQPQQTSGKFTGWLHKDLTGQKRKALEAFLGHALCDLEFAVFTDNRSDADLIEHANPAVLVGAGKPRKWMRRWNAEILCH